MLVMRLVFGKYGGLLILGVIVQTAVSVALLAQTLGLINPLVERYSNLITDWAPAPSTTAIVAAVAAAVVVAFIIIRKGRRDQALVRVRNWATDAVMKLTRPSKEKSVLGKMADWEERLQTIGAESVIALANARLIGKSFETNVTKAVKSLSQFESSFNDHTEAADLKVLLKTTVTAFTEVANFTGDSLWKQPQDNNGAKEAGRMPSDATRIAWYIAETKKVTNRRELGELEDWSRDGMRASVLLSKQTVRFDSATRNAYALQLDILLSKKQLIRTLAKGFDGLSEPVEGAITALERRNGNFKARCRELLNIIAQLRSQLCV